MIVSATERAPRRRWYQFSLRTLLVVMLLGAVTVGWVGGRIQRARSNRARIESVRMAIEQMGGFVKVERHALRPKTLLEGVFNDPGGIDDPNEIILSSTVYIDRFGSRSRMSSLFGHLASLDSLEALIISGTNTTNADLLKLDKLTDLRCLDLGKTRVSDSGVEHLSRLTEIRILNLSETPVTNAALETVKGMTKLKILGLESTQVNDIGLGHLRGLIHLQMLFLRDTQVTDVGVAQLKELSSLKELHLGGSQITDVGLAHLKGLTNLRYLGLVNTRVTADGISELQRALPKCKIAY